MALLYLLDVSSYLFRSYYAITRMTNPQGQSTNALYGTIRSVLKLLQKEEPEYLCAVMDGPSNKQSRQQLYQEYKAHRKEMPEDLPHQIGWAIQWFEEMGIPTLSIPGVEADDVMGSIATWAAKEGHDVRLCSSDKDLCQLINERILMMNPAKDYALVSTEGVIEQFGVRPDQMVDYLSLVGDPSDNIPGVSGCGPKTASQLLQKYHSLDQLFVSVHEVPGKKGETLRAEEAQARLSYVLATIDTQVDVPRCLEAYRRGVPHQEKLRNLYREMAFSSLLTELSSERPSIGVPESKAWPPPYELLDSIEKVQDFIDRLDPCDELCIDTETTHENPHLAKLVGIGVGMGDLIGYIPVLSIDSPALYPELARLLKLPKKGVVGHHLKYDLHILSRHGLPVPSIACDTLLASYVLFTHSHRHSLDYVMETQLQQQMTPITDLIGKGKHQITMDQVEVPRVASYCAEDVAATLALSHLLTQQLKDRGLYELFSRIEIPLISILFEMERMGIYVDAHILHSMKKEFGEILQRCEEKIFEAVGETFNLSSPKQLGAILYEKMGLKPLKKTQTGYSTSAEALEFLLPEAPFIALILEWRALEKLRNTYIEALPQFISPKDGRVHTTFNQSMTATGRLSSQDPNLQNIPIRSPEGLRIREAFRPQKEGWSYLSGDYSQIELRLLAHMSEDPRMIEAFQRNEDIHRFTASLIHEVPLEQVTSEMRQQAKAVNFGIIYGQQAFGLSQTIGISRQSAKQFIEQYYLRFPAIGQFLEKLKQSAKTSGRSITLTGRERLLPEITSSNAMIRAGAERLAVNSPLQGTAADLIKMAMLSCAREIKKRELKSLMILQIHDELLFECPDEELPSMKQLVRECMEGVMSLKVPLVVDLSVGRNWRECYS